MGFFFSRSPRLHGSFVYLKSVKSPTRTVLDEDPPTRTLFGLSGPGILSSGVWVRRRGEPQSRPPSSQTMEQPRHHSASLSCR